MSEVETQSVSVKNQLVDAVLSLLDPIGETPGVSVQDFLLRERFQETYREVLQQTGPILADDLLAEKKDLSPESLLEEGKNLVLWMDKGREAFEIILDYRTKTGTNKINMMNFWKSRGVVDETIEPERYRQRIAASPESGWAGSLQAHPVSKREKIAFLIGGFTWILPRGKPKEAINCLEDIAWIQESTTSALISHFEPVLSLMHKKAEDLDREVAKQGGLDALGGRPAAEYLLEMDEVMMKKGFTFDENHSIKPSTIAIA